MNKYICWLLFLFTTQLSTAQEKTPDAFLGYPLGTRFVFHQQILEYLKVLENLHPDRMKVVQYGTTNEGRPLVVAFIASPGNLARLETIRTDHLKSIGIRKGKAENTTLPIVWLSYNIHGNEAASANTSMKVVYELLNKNNPLTQPFLQNTVVIIDPCSNPDGYERYVQWYNRYRGSTPDNTPFALEHDEPWPGGRFNHYLFDLNRDWAWQTQTETKARIALYQQWMPHVHADFHEMTTNGSYYFPPAAKPIHKDVTSWQREFNETVGRYCRTYFDRNNWTYFTRSKYDLFFPSYGDTWPTYNGAIGITYEQSGGGIAGLALDRKKERDTLTLRARIDHHFATSMATLEAVSSQRERIVAEFIKFHVSAATSPSGIFKTYVIKSTAGTENLRPFTEWLSSQGFEYGRAGKNASAKGTDLLNDSEQNIKIEPNDLLISAFQPRSDLLRILFEPRPVLEDSVTYDATSWGLSYLFGLKSFGLKEKLIPVSFQFEKIENKIPEFTPYAYLVRWTDVRAVALLADLLKKNILVKTSNTPFEIDQQTFDAGTLLITRQGNGNAGFDNLVVASANENQVRLIPVKTGFVTSGADFGHDDVVSLKAPKVVAVAGNHISATSLGAVWHYFEQQIKYPVTLVAADKLFTLPWNEIDVLILPDGTYNNILDDKVMDLLQEWIRKGGKLIAMERATDAFLNKPGFALTRKPFLKKRDTDPLKKYGANLREETSDSSPGSMYQITLDTTHPLAFGCGDTYYSLVRNAYERDFLEKGWNVGYLNESGYKAGFVGRQMTDRLKNTLIMGVHEMDNGQIIYLMDDPLFRGMLSEGKMLFGNAVFR